MYPTTQTKTKTLTTKEIRIKVNLMPPWAEIICPPLQAFYNSPYWKPVMISDNVIFLWPDVSEVEAVYPINFGVWKSALLFRSRRRSLIYATPVSERRIPGRKSNMTKEFEIIDADTVTAAVALIITGSIERTRELLRMAVIELSSDYNYIVVVPREEEAVEKIKKLVIAKYTLV